jgi:hypothetical protein
MRWGPGDQWPSGIEQRHDGHPHVAARPRALRRGAAAGCAAANVDAGGASGRPVCPRLQSGCRPVDDLGSPPTETVSYTAVGSDPAWAFVEQRTGSVLVKFRVAPPYHVANAVGDRLAQAGVDARVGEVRSKPGSTRLFVRLVGSMDAARLKQELGALWQDYQRLK